MTNYQPVSEFNDQSTEPAVRGFLHTPENANGNALVLAHGAGGNCESKLSVAVSQAFSDAGFLVLRINLPSASSVRLVRHLRAEPHGIVKDCSVRWK